MICHDKIFNKVSDHYLISYSDIEPWTVNWVQSPKKLSLQVSNLINSDINWFIYTDMYLMLTRRRKRESYKQNTFSCSPVSELFQVHNVASKLTWLFPLYNNQAMTWRTKSSNCDGHLHSTEFVTITESSPIFKLLFCADPERNPRSIAIEQHPQSAWVSQRDKSFFFRFQWLKLSSQLWRINHLSENQQREWMGSRDVTDFYADAIMRVKRSNKGEATWKLLKIW